MSAIESNVSFDSRSFDSGSFDSRCSKTRRRKISVVAVLGFVVVGLLAGCQSGETESQPTIATPETTEADNSAPEPDADTTTTAVSTSEPETVESAETTVEVAPVPPTETFGSGTALETPTIEADKIVDVSIVDGEVQIEDKRIKVDAGSTVGIFVESDQTEHLHLHGYDILVDLVPGSQANFSFLADVTGTYEVELEDSGRFLFEIQVS